MTKYINLCFRSCVSTLVGTLMLTGITGCQAPTGTGNSNPPYMIPPKRIESVARLAAYTTAKVMLAKDENAMIPLNKACAGLNELVVSQQWDIATAIAIANANGLNELNSTEGQIALNALPLFIDLVGGETITLNDSIYGKAAIVGAASGLKMALSGFSRSYPTGPTAPTGPAAPVPATQLRKLQVEAAATRP